ncbi:MAG: organic solvent tolerance protein OstA [Pirellula sp.]
MGVLVTRFSSHSPKFAGACTERLKCALIRTLPLAYLIALHLFLGLSTFGQSLVDPVRNQATTEKVPRVEIGVPLVDPKFSIKASANEAVRQTDGGYEVITFKGNVRIAQGPFNATAEEATIWIDQTIPDSALQDHPRKYLIETRGKCDVDFGEGRSIQDEQWMGRLFSHFTPELNPRVWVEPIGPPPELSWTKNQFASESKDGNGSESVPAIAWTKADDANYVKLAAQLLESQSNQNQLMLGQPGLLLGNPGLGGTVIDGGLMMPTSQLPPPNTQPNNPPETVQSFQIGPPLETIPTAPSVPAPVAAPFALSSPPGTVQRRIGARTFAMSGRGSVEPLITSTNRPERGDSVITISRGIRLRFGDVSMTTNGGVVDLGAVLIEADRAVIWTSNLTKLLAEGGRIDDLPVEVYIEGNVVFQQGMRTIYADRMYYNVQAEYGMILGAEVYTDAPQFDGILRLKADVIQQRSRENFLAHQAALTTSRLGVPRYWLQADKVEFSDKSSQSPNRMMGFKLPGQTSDETGMTARARNNFVYVEGVPVFYWPVMDTNIDTSSYYLSAIKYQNDSIFGNQVLVDWNLYQLLGIAPIDGTRWRLSTDYLSERGFALGTNYQYNVPSFILGGSAAGQFDFWGIRDEGLDALGSDRVGLTPEETTRGRLLLQHRQRLGPDRELWAEAGWISDRNFLEQYFENEWDTSKDAVTGLRFRQYLDNQMFDLSGNFQVNDFHTETSWLPRLDHFWLGQSVADVFTYYSRTSVGYARQQAASTPLNAADAAKFQLQPNEVNADGVVATTRHELNLPFEFGFTKFVPFASGEAAFWGQDATGDSLTRLTGQAGWRSSTPVWKAYPNFQSRVFNLNGLVHKLSYESEFLYADSNQDLTQLPLYNPIDDNSQEHFRRRLVFNTFAGALPPEFDSTQFAARQSMQRYVSASSTEVVEDQLQSRFGIHQRLQTKRGRAGQERIADFIEFDIDAILFGKQDRDNFGEPLGGINYNFRYHLGDRVTLLSDGYYDMFDNGLHSTSLGGIINRPGRGDAYLGVTSMEGPISALVVVGTVNYRMNEKWLVTGGSTIDLRSTGNIGQSLAVTRIGESFLFRLGANIDYGRDNVSLVFAFEPRFFQRRGLGAVGGQLIGPAGLTGLE